AAGRHLSCGPSPRAGTSGRPLCSLLSAGASRAAPLAGTRQHEQVHVESGSEMVNTRAPQKSVSDPDSTPWVKPAWIEATGGRNGCISALHVDVARRV